MYFSVFNWSFRVSRYRSYGIFLRARVLPILRRRRAIRPPALALLPLWDAKAFRRVGLRNVEFVVMSGANALLTKESEVWACLEEKKSPSIIFGSRQIKIPVMSR